MALIAKGGAGNSSKATPGDSNKFFCKSRRAHSTKLFGYLAYFSIETFTLVILEGRKPLGPPKIKKRSKNGPNSQEVDYFSESN
jgi:hypothetical protein